MQVPYKPIYLLKAFKKFNYIVIHDLTCQFEHFEKSKTDDKKVAISDLRSYNWVFHNEFDLPYHFICKKIGTDYETIMSRPLAYFCEYPDISEQYINSVHIAIAGNYNFISPTTRAYQQIGYRSIASIMKWFLIPISNIKMHYEVSNNDKLKCPGVNFDKEKLLALIRPLLLITR